MTDQEAFELCLKKVRMLQSNIGGSRSCWPVEEMLGVHLHTTIYPSSRPIAFDYVVDFCNAGRRALRRWPTRSRLFDVYYGQAVPFTEAMKVMRLKEGTFLWYSAEIQKTVGRELKHQRLVPGKKFQNELEEAEKAAKKLKVKENAKKAKKGKK